MWWIPPFPSLPSLILPDRFGFSPPSRPFTVLLLIRHILHHKLQLIHYLGASSLDGDDLGATDPALLHKHGTFTPCREVNKEIYGATAPAEPQPAEIILLPFPPDNFCTGTIISTLPARGELQKGFRSINSNLWLMEKEIYKLFPSKKGPLQRQGAMHHFARVSPRMWREAGVICHG